MTDMPSESIGNDQRWRHQIIGTNFRRDSAFEVAIAGEDRDCDERMVFNRFGDIRGQGAGISDARSAAIPNGIEPERVKVRR
jgi:hypothetical protein